VQRHLRRLHVLVGEDEAVLHLVDHHALGRRRGVVDDAAVLERRAEVQAVEPHLGTPAPIRSFLLRKDSATRSCSDAGRTRGLKAAMLLLRAAGGGGEVHGEAYPRDAHVLLLLEHGSVVTVPHCRHGAHDAGELELHELVLVFASSVESRTLMATFCLDC
jgi:hypothetical protein